MTKPRKRWPDELDKPVRHLPVQYLTHGGRVNETTIMNYSESAIQSIANGLHAEWLRKLPLLADYYKVGHQNYKGLAKSLAAEFIPKSVCDLDMLKQEFGAINNQSLVILLAAKYVRGFQYEPLIINPENTVVASQVTTREELVIISGAIRNKLANGRRLIWTKNKLIGLLEAVEKLQSKCDRLTDREALLRLKRSNGSGLDSFELDTLENRLQDAKNLKNPGRSKY
jgi:hypothetical protein